MHKKGISPLIATVVLIAFAVALGAVIMNWGSHLVETATNETLQCENLVFAVHSFTDGDYDLCFSDTNLIFTVKSIKGKIDGIKLVAYTTGENLFRNANVLSKKLEPGDPQRINIPYSASDYGDIREVELFAMLGHGQDVYLCPTPVKVSNVARCD